jgi:hypothetical protein
VSGPHSCSLREHYPADVTDLEPFETELWPEDLEMLDEEEGQTE